MPKKKSEEQVEESEQEEELEEIVEDEEDSESVENEFFDENKFTEFLELDEDSSPVLSKVNAFQQRVPFVNLESEISPNGISSEKDEEKSDFKYSIGQKNSNEPKYAEFSKVEDFSSIEMPARVDPFDLGNKDMFERPEIKFSSSENRGIQSNSIEKYTVPERFDEEKARKENPFGKKPEVKYRPGGY